MFSKIKTFAKSNKGFTFVEVMISITILSVVVIPLLTLIPQNFRALANANRRAILLNLAKNVDEYYMSLAYMGSGDLLVGTKDTGKIGDLGFNMSGIDEPDRYRYEVEYLNHAQHPATTGFLGLLYVTIRVFYDQNDPSPADNSIDAFVDADPAPAFFIEYVTAYARPDKDGGNVY